MAGCCNYLGTCRACIGNGKYWFSTRNHSSCCAFEPNLCGESIAKMAETLGDCKDPADYTATNVSGAVLAVFFVIAIVVIILVVRKGGIPRFFRRRGHGEEMSPMIPLVTFRRSDSVIALDLAQVELM